MDEDEDQMGDETPDWYDESKVVRAIYAIEGDRGHSSYGGYVQDLGDGTCRFTNSPMLGEGGPEWGDRVDLFYNPCSPFGRPMVGYRIYPDGVEPTGRSFGLERTPDEEEIAEHKEDEERREKAELEDMERRFEERGAPFKLMEAESKASDERIRYIELKEWVKDQGLEVPDDLHEKKRAEPEEKTDEEKKDSKLFLLGIAEIDYPEITVTDEEVQARIKKMREQDALADSILEQFDGQ